MSEGSLEQPDFEQPNLEQTPIDPDSPAYGPILEDLQGNIFIEHGRLYSRYLILSFKAGQNGPAAAWVRGLKITSTADQLGKEDQGIFHNFSLSSPAYGYFGYEQVLPRDDVFLATMKQLNLTQIGLPITTSDPPIDQWEEPYQQEIHAVLLLAGNDPEALAAEIDATRAEVEPFAEILTIEEGFRQTNNQDVPTEPFGYVDGISQPVFIKDRGDQYQQFDASDQWDPYAPPSLVLVKDPNSGPSAFGSYLVFRKLEQDVDGFNQGVSELAASIGVDEDQAGAQVVGRFKDGTPVVLHDQPEDTLDNNFNYSIDPQGARCPFHSHIRKSNPRGDTTRLLPTPENEQVERSHRILRRPVPYGVTPGEESPTKGLLFLCYQGHIAHQFLFIQAAWSNQSDFVVNNVGPDTVSGQQGATLQEWPAVWGNPTSMKPFAFERYVHFRGGEYFFTPSISFLASI